MQVCCEKSCTNDEVEKWLNEEEPTGIASQWRIRKQGDELLNGADERVQCASDPERVHIMLDC